MPPRVVGRGVRPGARAAARRARATSATGPRRVTSATGRHATLAIGRRAEMSVSAPRAILATGRHVTSVTVRRETSVTGRHVILAIDPHATARTSLSSGHAEPRALAHRSAKDHRSAVAALAAAAGGEEAAASDRVDHRRAVASDQRLPRVGGVPVSTAAAASAKRPSTSSARTPPRTIRTAPLA
jgi:hypothetical protein